MAIIPSPLAPVWYSTRCPVCNGGIDWQRNKLLTAVRAGHIAFKDINEHPDALAQYGASLDDVRRLLHATDEVGRLIVGADVALAVLRATPDGAGGCTAYFFFAPTRLMLLMAGGGRPDFSAISRSCSRM